VRLRGFALSELLVAVAIAGLIIGVLTYLNVDYVALSRRIGDLQAPNDLGRRAEALANADRCAVPGSVLTPGQDAVVAQSRVEARTVLSLAYDPDGMSLAADQGPVGASRQPIRIIVERSPAPGPSAAAIEVGDATVGVVAPRCDLPEVCHYDATNALCREDETLAEPG
jgi:hypothetical protein